MNIELNQPEIAPQAVLGTGHRAGNEFFEMVRCTIEEIMPAMQPGVSYTVEMMFGRDAWRQLDDYEHQLAGRCVADMVCRGVLPLEFAGRTSANARLYRLR